MATVPLSGQTPLRILTPAVRPRLAFPARSLVFILVASALYPAHHFSKVGALEAAAVLFSFPAFYGAIRIGAWAEAVLFMGMQRRGVPARILVALILPVLAPAAGIAAATQVKPLSVAVGAGDFAGGIIVVGFLWFAGAALGSLVVVFIDLVISAMVPGFRERIMLAILVLVVLVFLLAVGVVMGAPTLLEWMLAQAAKGNFQMDGKITIEGKATDVTQLMKDHPTAVLAGALALTGLLGLPAMISACGKLADAVMERFHPLIVALEALGKGERDVRLEVAGSTDFQKVSRSFNVMAEALTLAERMERAFGQYVSPQVLSRIRAQHGEAALPASLRDATVFFADIRGFTSMSEKHTPDVVVGVLNKYFERVVATINAHDGYLNKFIGDAVVVVFNGPIDQPDHAERATRCAIAIQNAVDELNASGAFGEVGSLRVGIGISTGSMVCGNVGSARQMEYTVIGDTVNLSARLTSQAPAGEIWISEPTARGLPLSLPTTPLEPMKVKGKDLQVTPHRVWPADPARTLSVTTSESRLLTTRA